jgi:toxin ParE1/3/4
MQIRWTDPALDDFTRICDHSDAHFGQTRGRRTALQIYETVDSLAEFPHIGRMGRKAGTSELVIQGLPFLVVYRLKNETVEIVRILHGAQQWP